MAGPISQRFIDDLLARVDIGELVGERVVLKKAGRNLSGLCPFHDEKSPSFTVSREKQFYHCFGCGAHGNALRFLMEYDRLSFPEAVEQLAQRQGMEVEREDDHLPAAQKEKLAEQRRKRDAGVNLLELASDWFRQQLTEQHAAEARRYLDGRGLNSDIIDAFAIGFAPDSWDGLKQYLNGHSVAENVQVEYGLLRQREDDSRTWDLFRNRVIFPIRDWKGRTLGFGGRVLGDAKPKYLNSPETPVFHKGRELYGLYEARQQKSNIARLVVVEGYMDVVALAQHGIHNAVATLGTAITEEHLTRLYRVVDEVVFCFDGDGAGRRAAKRALEVALPSMIDGRQARFLFLPEGEDPDSLVRQEGKEAFQARIECASPLSEFLFDQAREGLDLKRVEGRERFVAHVLEKLRLLPQGVLHSLLMEELSTRSGISVSRLEQFVAPASQAAQPQDNAAASDTGETSVGAGRFATAGRTTKVHIGSAPITRALHLLVHNPGLSSDLPEQNDWCPESEDGLLFIEVARLLKAGGYRSSQVLLAHFHGTEQGARLITLLKRAPDMAREDQAAELRALIDMLYKQRQRLSPEEEYQQLLAVSRSGQKLTATQQHRLLALIEELGRR
ncbi:DNA primase [Carnimonas sp. R-84981]|uniref:DNA primase n=1 Tax=Carnimonas bestiolae TaxID=3402172 RepID=UPI003EDC6E3C